MPSTLHEVLIELFRQQPELAAELLSSVLAVDLPSYQQARLESGELTDVALPSGAVGVLPGHPDRRQMLDPDTARSPRLRPDPVGAGSGPGSGRDQR